MPTYYLINLFFNEEFKLISSHFSFTGRVVLPQTWEHQAYVEKQLCTWFLTCSVWFVFSTSWQQDLAVWEGIYQGLLERLQWRSETSPLSKEGPGWEGPAKWAPGSHRLREGSSMVGRTLWPVGRGTAGKCCREQQITSGEGHSRARPHESKATGSQEQQVWHEACTGWCTDACLPARPRTSGKKDRARSEGTWARQVGQVLDPEEPCFVIGWKLGIGAQIRIPEVGHESRVVRSSKASNSKLELETEPSIPPAESDLIQSKDWVFRPTCSLGLKLIFIYLFF